MQMYFKTNLESKNAEDNNTGKDGCSTVDQGDHNGITVAVIVHWIVTGHGDQPSKGNTEGEENLSGCFQPDLGINQL